jgi:hypothetical protein
MERVQGDRDEADGSVVCDGDEDLTLAICATRLDSVLLIGFPVGVQS